MEYIGVPLVALVRELGPPTLVLAVGATTLLLRGRPRRTGLLWAALGTHLLAASLPFLWLTVQVSTGLTGETYVALIMTLVQPAVETVAWLLVLAVVFAHRPRSGAPGVTVPADAASDPLLRKTGNPFDFLPTPKGGGFQPSQVGFPASSATAPEQARHV